MKRQNENNAFAPKKSFPQRVKETLSGRTVKLGGYSAISILVVVVIAVVINLCVGKLPSSMTTFDTSKDKLSSISAQTKEIVSGLSEPVSLYWIAQSGEEDVVIEQLLARYEDLSDKLTVEQIDPIVNPNFASQYTDGTVTNNCVIAVCGERSKFIPYTDIYVTDYSNYYTTGQTSTTFYGETELTSAIDYVTKEDMPKMYQLRGHGSNAPDTSLSNMIAKQNILLSDLNLLTEANVPEDCDLLLIFAPESDLSKAEAEAVKAYLQKGGKLLLVSNYNGTDMPNLVSVMEAYGVTMEKGIVFEGGKNGYYQYPYWLLPQIESHVITEPLADGYYVLYPQAQALTVSQTLPDGVTVSPLLSTTSSGYIKEDVSNLTTLEKEEKDKEGTYTVAAAISDENTGAQAVWFSGAFFTQSNFDEVVSGTNTDLFLNAVSWMCKSESDITIHAKTITNEFLTISAGTRAVMIFVMVGLLPIACIGFGIYIWAVRRKR